jgi:hypothetical protein
VQLLIKPFKISVVKKTDSAIMRKSLLLLTLFSVLIPSVCAAQKDSKEKSKLDGKVSVNARIIDG